MRVLFLSSEVAPFSKTGGLGDVAGALPAALASLGHEVRVVSPLYGSVPREGLVPEKTSVVLTFPFGSREARFQSTHPKDGLTFTFVEQPDFFGKSGLYGELGQEYPDNARRFTFFSSAALTYAQAIGFHPDVVHLNDWQTGLAAMALKTGYSKVFANARSVFTIHNLAYQGNYSWAEVEALGIPWSRFTTEGVEFYGKLSFMKAGLSFADAITTVSPTYAEEIQTPLGGVGFDGVLRAKKDKLHGILNGVDVREWNPATDVLLPARYSAEDLSGRAKCQKALLDAFGLEGPRPGKPLFGFVGRMVEQKGVDLLLAALPQFLEHGASAVVLGTGESRFENAWRTLSHRFPKRLGGRIGFDNALAHLIEAGSDFFLMPSRFEPCGLNQMYSSLYGAVPIVRAVGGLVDTVTDEHQPGGTGIVFQEPTADALRGALHRALELFANPERYARVRKAGMVKDFSWEGAARKYDALYRSLLPAPPGQVT
jgi:starch synthase